MLYILPLGLIFKKYGISFHVYADDIQLYLSFKPNGVNALGELYACIQELKVRLREHFLMLDEGKSEVILFGPSDAFNASNYNLGHLHRWVTPFAKKLWFDSGLKFDKHINGVVKLCFFHLRRLAKVNSFLSTKNFVKVIHTFIIT